MFRFDLILNNPSFIGQEIESIFDLKSRSVQVDIYKSM